MKTFLAILLAVVGPACAVLLTSDFGWSGRAIAAAVGCLFTWPVAAALCGVRRVSRAPQIEESWKVDQSIMSPRAVAENYWRDRAHPPFMRPPQGPPDHHQFDPDRLN